MFQYSYQGNILEEWLQKDCQWKEFKSQIKGVILFAAAIREWRTNGTE